MPHVPGPRTRTTRRFFREVHVHDFGLVVRRWFVTNLRLRCPACGLGRVTSGPWSVRTRCDRCDSRFDRMEGNELIAIPSSFFLTVTILLAISLIVVPRTGFFDGLMPALAALGIVCVLLLVRPMRVLTLWFLWLFGFVYPDAASEPGVHELPVRDGGEAPR